VEHELKIPIRGYDVPLIILHHFSFLLSFFWFNGLISKFILILLSSFVLALLILTSCHCLLILVLSLGLGIRLLSQHTHI
jgi:hypothetical protein